MHSIGNKIVFALLCINTSFSSFIVSQTSEKRVCINLGSGYYSHKVMNKNSSGFNFFISANAKFKFIPFLYSFIYLEGTNIEYNNETINDEIKSTVFISGLGISKIYKNKLNISPYISFGCFLDSRDAYSLKDLYYIKKTKTSPVFLGMGSMFEFILKKNIGVNIDINIVSLLKGSVFSSFENENKVFKEKSLLLNYSSGIFIDNYIYYIKNRILVGLDTRFYVWSLGKPITIFDSHFTEDIDFSIKNFIVSIGISYVDI